MDAADSAARTRTSFLPQIFFEETVSLFALCFRKIMAAIWMFHVQTLGHPVKFIHLGSSFHNFIHAGPFEIGVAKRRVDENGARRQRANKFMKIEGDFRQTI